MTRTQCFIMGVVCGILLGIAVDGLFSLVKHTPTVRAERLFEQE